MKQATLDLIKNIDENTFIPPSTKNELRAQQQKKQELLNSVQKQEMR